MITKKVWKLNWLHLLVNYLSDNPEKEDVEFVEDYNEYFEIFKRTIARCTFDKDTFRIYVDYKEYFNNDISSEYNRFIYLLNERFGKLFKKSNKTNYIFYDVTGKTIFAYFYDTETLKVDLPDFTEDIFMAGNILTMSFDLDFSDLEWLSYNCDVKKVSINRSSSFSELILKDKKCILNRFTFNNGLYIEYMNFNSKIKNTDRYVHNQDFKLEIEIRDIVKAVSLANFALDYDVDFPNDVFHNLNKILPEMIKNYVKNLYASDKFLYGVVMRTMSDNLREKLGFENCPLKVFLSDVKMYLTRLNKFRKSDTSSIKLRCEATIGNIPFNATLGKRLVNLRTNEHLTEYQILGILKEVKKVLANSDDILMSCNIKNVYAGFHINLVANTLDIQVHKRTNINYPLFKELAKKVILNGKTI